MASFQRVQFATSSAGVATITPTAGNALVAAIYCSGVASPTISDTSGNNWEVITTVQNSGTAGASGVSQVIAVALNVAGGITVVTALSEPLINFTIVEYSGVAGVDTFSSQTGAASLYSAFTTQETDMFFGSWSSDSATDNSNSANLKDSFGHSVSGVQINLTSGVTPYNTQYEWLNGSAGYAPGINFGTSGIISTFAGSGTSGFVGDSGPAISAGIANPQSVAVDSSGNVYLSDFGNNRIRKVNTSGVISTFAGNGTAGFAGDGGQAAASGCELNQPIGIALDSAGNLYFLDFGNARLRKINTSGVISTFAGNGTNGFGGDGGQAAASGCKISSAYGVAVDPSGNVYIGDTSNKRVRIVNTSGVISTFAGNGTGGFAGDGGQAAASGCELNFPRGLAADSAGNIYIADATNNRIRIVNTSGVISTFAGNGTGGFAGDGGQAAASGCEISNPYGVVTDSAGNVYIVDNANSRIRIVNASGVINTFAGNGTGGFAGDGGQASSAEISPRGVAIDSAGNVYLADYGTNRIRKVSSDVITRPQATTTGAWSVVALSSTPEITWANPSPITYGTALSGTQLNATASVGGTFAYTPPSGTVLNAGNGQTLSVVFTPTDTASFVSASASVSINVTPISSTITWSNPSPIVYGTALSGTQLNATFAPSAGTAVYTPAAGTILGAGNGQSLSVTWTPSSSNYSAATSGVTINVTKATPTITWNTPAPITQGTPLTGTQLNATANTGGTFVYAPPAGTILLVGSNVLDVTFTPTDSTDYTTATDHVNILVTGGSGVIVNDAGGNPGYCNRRRDWPLASRTNFVPEPYLARPSDYYPPPR